jgi:hypothetical protein
MEVDNLKQMIKEMLGGMEERIKADRKTDKEDFLTRIETVNRCQSKEGGGRQKELLARMKED